MNALRATVTLSVLLLLRSAAAAASGFDMAPSGVAYPSGATVPENLLRIELRFSAPLKSLRSMDHIKLNDVAAASSSTPSSICRCSVRIALGQRSCCTLGE